MDILRPLISFTLVVGMAAACTPQGMIDINSIPTPITATYIPPTQTLEATLELPTATPEATATEIPTSTPAPEVDPYEIDMLKIRTIPKSFAEFRANRIDYQRMPDPLGASPGEGEKAFVAWFDKLTTNLGDQHNLPTTLAIDHILFSPGEVTSEIRNDKGHPVDGPLMFSYFTHGGKLYPVIGVTCRFGGWGNYGTYFVILDEPNLLDGDGENTLQNLQDSERLVTQIVAWTQGIMPDVRNKTMEALVNAPFNWEHKLAWGEDGDFPNHYEIGVGIFRTKVK